MAPEKPAMNDVHPVKNAAIGPNASRRYTYSPPARGRSADNSAYAIAPAKASAPPISHTHRIAPLDGTIWATIIGTKKMPPPITFETTMAAASMGPSRRSRNDEDFSEVAGTEALRDTWALLRQQLSRDRHALQIDPLRRALLAEDLHFHVLKVTVLEHLQAGLRRVPGVAPLRADGHRLRLVALEVDTLHVYIVDVIG